MPTDIQRVDYATSKVPDNYRCQKCGNTGCKLWRGSDGFYGIVLLCCDCAALQEGTFIQGIDDKGQYMSVHGFKVNEIGFYLPAVPDKEGVGYWGHGTTPQEAFAWWLRLPTRI